MITGVLPWLAHLIPSLGPLGSLSVRSAASAVVAFATVLLLGPRVLAWLKSRQVIEVQTNTDSPQLNEINRAKQPTPTMGGLMILGGVLAAVLICGDLGNPFVLMGVLSTIGYGLIGLTDDWVKLTRRDRRGLSPRAKFLLQFLVALSLAVVVTLVFKSRPEAEAKRLLALHVPFTGWTLDLSWARGLPHVLMVLVVVSGASNAVNLTDGMDGLASGTMVIAALAMAAICVVVGRAPALELQQQLVYVRQSQEMTVFCTAMAGATLGFLWFNASPALVYMGDTGSLPLGSLLGYVAVVVKQELVLLIIGGVFVLEALSVIAQVSFFRATGGKRLLRCAPLHHHFQFGGVPDQRIVVRFWILGVLLAGLGMASLAVG
jgi:phospho-N-acetylmuramoyl-pentapeptide-transferase